MENSQFLYSQRLQAAYQEAEDLQLQGPDDTVLDGILQLPHPLREIAFVAWAQGTEFEAAANFGRKQVAFRKTASDSLGEH